MTSGTKALLILLGLLTVVFILMQLTMGLLILNGKAELRKAHQHSGYVTVVLTLAYVALSLRVLLGIRARDAA